MTVPINMTFAMQSNNLFDAKDKQNVVEGFEAMLSQDSGGQSGQTEQQIPSNRFVLNQLQLPPAQLPSIEVVNELTIDGLQLQSKLRLAMASGQSLLATKPPHQMSMQPSEFQQMSMQPSEVQQMSMQPSEVQQMSMQPSEVQQMSMQPSKIQQMSMQPSEVQQMSILSSELQQMLMQPSEVQQMTMQSSKVQQMTMQSSKVELLSQLQLDVEGAGKPLVTPLGWQTPLMNNPVSVSQFIQPQLHESLAQTLMVTYQPMAPNAVQMSLLETTYQSDNQVNLISLQAPTMLTVNIQSVVANTNDSGKEQLNSHKVVLWSSIATGILSQAGDINQQQSQGEINVIGATPTTGPLEPRQTIYKSVENNRLQALKLTAQQYPSLNHNINIKQQVKGKVSTLNSQYSAMLMQTVILPHKVTYSEQLHKMWVRDHFSSTEQLNDIINQLVGDVASNQLQTIVLNGYTVYQRGGA